MVGGDGGRPLVNQGVYFCPPITYHYFTHLCFSSIFFSHTLNEGLHPVCAFLTHRFRDMAIAIEGERCGVVSHVFLNRLDIITCTDGINREGVTQIIWKF